MNKVFRQQDPSINVIEPEDYAKLGSHASTSTISKTAVIGTKNVKTMNEKTGSPVAITPSINGGSANVNAVQNKVSSNATREQPSTNKAASSTSSVSKVTISTSTSGAKRPSSSTKKNKTKVNAMKNPSSSYSDQAQEGSSSVIGTDDYLDSTENPTTILPPAEEQNVDTTELSISEQLAMIPITLTGSVDSIVPETSNYDATVQYDSTTTELPLKQESTAAPLSAEIGTSNSNSSTSISTATVLPYVEGSYPTGQEYLSAVMTTVQPESAEVQANVVTEPSTSSERVVTSTTALPSSGTTSTESGSISVGQLIQLESLTLRPEVATEYFPLATEEELSSGSSVTTALPLDDFTVTSAKTDVLASTPLPTPATISVEPHKDATTSATSTGTVTMMPAGSNYANYSPPSVGGLYLQVVTETVPKNNQSSSIAVASSSSLTATPVIASTVQSSSTKLPSISNPPTAEQNNKSPAQYNGSYSIFNIKFAACNLFFIF